MQSKPRTKAGSLASGRLSKREAAVLAKAAKQIATCTWDFSTDGGAIGTYSFGVKLPANAVVTNVYSDELTAWAGTAGGTAQLKAGSTNLTDAVDYAGDAGTQSRALASSATAIKLSAESELKAAIATQAATAGKIRWAVEFYVSE